MTSGVPLAVLPPGSVRAMPVPVLTMLAKSLADVWLITHFWLTALVQAVSRRRDCMSAPPPWCRLRPRPCTLNGAGPVAEFACQVSRAFRDRYGYLAEG